MCSFHTIVISLRLNVTLTIPGGFATALFHTHKTQNPWRVRARARARACTSPASREHRKLLSKDQKCSCGLVPVPAMFIELTDYIKQCSAITSSSAYFFIQFFFYFAPVALEYCPAAMGERLAEEAAAIRVQGWKSMRPLTPAGSETPG